MMIDLFKTGVWQKNIFENNNFVVEQNEKLKNFCIEYSQNVKNNVKYSNEGGYQSYNLEIKSHDFFQSIFDEIFKEIDNYALHINLKKQYLSRFWFNINKFKDYNLSHAHSSNELSGVYYVDTPIDCGDIVFERPNDTMLEACWTNSDFYNLYNSITYTLPAIAGHLYIFPSFLKHRVLPNKNKNLQRISISFDTNSLKK
jgi:uncharacterized protein (TIGR02466 family)